MKGNSKLNKNHLQLLNEVLVIAQNKSFAILSPEPVSNRVICWVHLTIT